MVHMTTVSVNTSKIPHIPWTTGSFVSEFVCTVTELPSPASLEKTPLEIPFFMARVMPYPRTPPPAALGEKAPWKMDWSVDGTRSMWTKMMTMQPSVNKAAMTGMTFSVTLAIRLMPPMMTKPTIKRPIRPVMTGEMEKVEDRADDIELACAMFPIPREARMQNMANREASHLEWRPRSIYTMAPPAQFPSLSL